jgi:hypothetical protein
MLHPICSLIPIREQYFLLEKKTAQVWLHLPSWFEETILGGFVDSTPP